MNPNITLLISLVGALTAISSLVLSLSSYKRDQGRLDVKIGIWHQMDLTTQQKLGISIIRISIVNSGRRPIVIDSIGGYPRFWIVGRTLNKIFPKLFPVIGFFVYQPEFEKQMRDKDGEYQVLAEGKKIVISLPLKNQRNVTKFTWKQVAAMYAGDSTGREHFIPNSVFSKFKADIEEHFGNYS